MLCKCIYILTFTINKFLHMFSHSVLSIILLVIYCLSCTDEVMKVERGDL